MIESLETRIAPAAVVSFFEVDGDKVTVKTNRGTTAQLEEALLITRGTTGVDGFTLDLIATPELAAAFAGTNVTITASGPGNKLADFVAINAFNGGGADNIDLNKVNVKGNLVFIDVGDNAGGLAINSLTVTSFVPDKGEPFATVSEIHGDINCVNVKRDFNGFIQSVDMSGAANFTDALGTIIGKFIVGGYVASGSGDDVGHLQVNGINKLVIKKTMFGATTDSDMDGTLDRHNGSIETTFINLMAIKRMSLGASIVLT
ncbi:MAG: hypothetical protein ABMA13_13115 [Chthoniobacteraceae bacterium]